MCFIPSSGILNSFVLQRASAKILENKHEKSLQSEHDDRVDFSEQSWIRKTKGKRNGIGNGNDNDNIIWHSLSRIDKWSLSVRNKYPAIERQTNRFHFFSAFFQFMISFAF